MSERRGPIVRWFRRRRRHYVVDADRRRGPARSSHELGRRRTVSHWTRRHRVEGICVGLIALVAAGCASARPLASTKVAQAERALDEAQQMGAVTMAPTELRTAEDKLKEAQTAMAKGDYESAMRLADQATADA